MVNAANTRKLATVLMIVFIATIVCAYVDAQAQIMDYHYDDEDGHRGPWLEWKEASCITEPVVIMDSSECDMPCNPDTNKGVTVWMCTTDDDIPHNVAFYTAHWYCGTLIEPVQLLHTYLPFLSK